jgi:membrane protease YdiL (CAAX protease family)
MAVAAVPTALLILVLAGIAAEATRRVFPKPLGAAPWLASSLTDIYLLLLSFGITLALLKKPSESLGLRACPLKALVKAAIAGSVCFIMAGVVFALLHFRPPEFFGHFSILQQIFFIWILASFAEEVLTRGLLQGMMAVWSDRSLKIATLRLPWPVIVSAAFFGLMHLALLTQGADLAAVAFIVASAFVLGLVAGEFRYLTGSLWPAVVAHSFADIAGTMLGTLARR